MKLVLYIKDKAVLGKSSPEAIDAILQKRAEWVLKTINPLVHEYIADSVIDSQEGKKEALKEAPKRLSDKRVRELLELLGRELEARVAKHIGPLKQLDLKKVKGMRTRKFVAKLKQ